VGTDGAYPGLFTPLEPKDHWGTSGLFPHSLYASMESYVSQKQRDVGRPVIALAPKMDESVESHVSKTAKRGPPGRKFTADVGPG
jgi:hypothetical protein